MTAVNPGMAIEKTSVASVSRSNRRSTEKIGQDSAKNAENLAQSDIIPMEAQEGANPTQEVEAKYTKMGESFRRNAPKEMQCSMFCGGRRCKYEQGSSWKKEDMAIDGIYSHWITDDILAMARPNTAAMKKHSLVTKFKNARIRSIINLQTPGEHASCGPNLQQANGFTYDPNEFMSQDIFYYNFAWKDYGEASSMSGLLDMVKVLSFALTEGKVAVHCHAGLGRTGVLVSAYLVYYLRVRSNDAIRYVRLKRPGAVQTRRQIDCVKEFESYFLPQCLVFSTKAPGDPDRKAGRFTIEQCLKRQKYVLHGYEARSLKYIPKLVYKVCERIIKLCNNDDEFGEIGSIISLGRDTISTTEDDNSMDVDQHSSMSNPSSKEEKMLSYTRTFIAYKFDNRGTRLLNFKSPSTSSMGNGKGVNGGIQSNQSTPSDSIIATRRSSQSFAAMSTDDELQLSSGSNPVGSRNGRIAGSGSSSISSSGFPTPISGMSTRPGSKTTADGSYTQSCSSALSSVDDRRMDELLADGVREQKIQENMVTQELAAHEDMQRIAASESLPRYKSLDVVSNILLKHSEIVHQTSNNLDQKSSPMLYADSAKLLKLYKKELNFKMSAWDRLETENDLFVLTGLLLEWLEHLRAPALGKDAITYIVIHCDNVETAISKISVSTAYLLEYLVRFVARLKPNLSETDAEDVMRRLSASLNQQTAAIRNIEHPAGKKFPKLRGGTEESTLKFMMKLYHMVGGGTDIKALYSVKGIAEQEPEHKSSAGGNAAAEAMASQLHNNHRLQQMASEGYELSAKSIGGRRTPAINNISKVP